MSHCSKGFSCTGKRYRCTRCSDVQHRHRGPTYPSLTNLSRLAFARMDSHGHRSICAQAAAHVLCACGSHPVSRGDGGAVDADRHLSGDRHSGRHGDLAVHRVAHAGDGTARYHVQPVCDLHQRQRHPRHRGADAQRRLGAEDLLSARCESRSGDLADRRRDELHPRAAAGRHPGAGGRAVQRVERAGAADRALLRHPQRAAALRLRHLSAAPAARADSRRHLADAGWRQVPPDHGRHRPGQAAGQGPHARPTWSTRSTPRT